jgi:hypothetical protein
VIVNLGTNTFIDCETIVSIKGNPTLRLASDPLRLTIVTPTDLPSGRVVRVVNNQLEPVPGETEASSNTRVVAGDKSATVFWQDFLIAVATQLDDGSAHLHVDFRPIGINIFDDASGLHVGGMHLLRSVVNSKIAFVLG